MPRKATKTAKPPLLFLERALCGARLQNAPEVRAAFNPKEFFTEKQEHNCSALKSWVSPQFDTSAAAVPPVRRGRRKCQSATSILDGCSQLSRKSSVCKFPSLTFQTRSRDQPHQPKSTQKKTATECPVLPDTGRQPQGLRRTGTISSAQSSDTPKRRTTSVRQKNVARHSEGAASSSRCSDQPRDPSVQVQEPRAIPADGASTPASSEPSNTEVSSVSPPPDVDTPKVIQEGSGGPFPTSLRLLQPQSSALQCKQQPDILVADTPERDYGLKVTWRRRRGLMFLLKEKGHLSDLDVLIHSSFK